MRTVALEQDLAEAAPTVNSATSGDKGYTLLGEASEPPAVDSKNTAYEAALDQELGGELTGQTSVVLQSLGGGEFWGTERDLDENAYGAAAVSLIRDIPKLVRQLREGSPWQSIALTVARLFFCLGLMTVNLIFQSLVLFYIYVFVVQPSVRNVQSLYADFHSTNFDENGVLLPDAWQHFPDKSEVCQITISSPAFYFGILTLWGLLMMMELRSCQRVAELVWNVRAVETMDEMVEYVASENYELGGRCLVIGLTKGIRFAVLVFVCLPRVIIGFLLLFMGCQWLSSAASFSDMTLNAMALEFVKNIDEILYEAILPKRLITDIADTNVFIIEKRKTKTDLDREEWKGYRRTTYWVVFMALFLGGFGTAVQTVLPFDLSELSFLCQEQVKLDQTPLCTKSTVWGMSESCYKKGQGGSSDGRDLTAEEVVEDDA